MTNYEKYIELCKEFTGKLNRTFGLQLDTNVPDAVPVFDEMGEGETEYAQMEYEPPEEAPDRYVTGLEEFLRFLRFCKAEHDAAVLEESELDKQTQDLLHSLELDEHKDTEMLQISLVLAEIRQDRRRVKDIRSVTEPIAEWYRTNKNAVNSLEQLLGAVRKAEKRTERRSYVPKTNILECLKEVLKASGI